MRPKFSYLTFSVPWTVKKNSNNSRIFSEWVKEKIARHANSSIFRPIKALYKNQSWTATSDTGAKWEAWGHLTCLWDQVEPGANSCIQLTITEHLLCTGSPELLVMPTSSLSSSWKGQAIKQVRGIYEPSKDSPNCFDSGLWGRLHWA